jgi:hypothetical protein
MHKQMFVCSRCGFTAFVERPRELELAGWRGETLGDGTSTIFCAACASGPAQGATEDPSPSRARTKSRPS